MLNFSGVPRNVIPIVKEIVAKHERLEDQFKSILALSSIFDIALIAQMYNKTYYQVNYILKKEQINLSRRNKEKKKNKSSDLDYSHNRIPDNNIIF